jgi:hypothetical protein
MKVLTVLTPGRGAFAPPLLPRYVPLRPPMLAAGLLPTPVLVLLLAGVAPFGFWDGLGGGAGFVWGADLAGVGCLLGAAVSFWSPQASAEKRARSKNANGFFRIVLFTRSNP